MNNKVVYLNRKNTNSKKWDDLTPMFGEENLHAMWVADMDFQAPDCIRAALLDYVNFGVLGYYTPPNTYYDSFINWEKTYHNYTIDKEWISFAPGVVPAINWFIQILTKPRDSIIVLTPVYYPFLDAINNNNRNLVSSNLINSKGIYSIDFNDFEKKIVDNKVKLFILCSPHNPVGRVWTSSELRKLMEICIKHNVYVISDEIHQDIVFENSVHTPTATIGNYDDILVTLTAATKTFNLAACQNSFVIIPNKEIRDKYDKFKEEIRVLSGNAFGYIAVEAAYTHGRPWFEAVKSTIYENYIYVKNTFNKELPLLEISPLEGTYLLWINFKNYLKGDEIPKFMQEKCKLALDYGSWFGGEDTDTFVRMNLATSRESINIAISTIIKEIKNLL